LEDMTSSNDEFLIQFFKHEILNKSETTNV